MIMPTMLEVNDLVHRYGTGSGAHLAVDDLTFTVESGQLACIVGPSGCGKSTLLRCIAGLITPSAGEIRLHGDLVSGVPRDLAVVFQDYSRSLFPWLTVRRNVEFPLRGRVSGRAERRERAVEALGWVGLSDVGNKYPWQLSGGMQQRVSIARALATRPALLLMDEPFASVDAQTRAELEDLLLRVRREHEYVHEGWAVIGERLVQSGPELGRLLDPVAGAAHAGGQGGEVDAAQFRAGHLGATL